MSTEIKFVDILRNEWRPNPKQLKAAKDVQQMWNKKKAQLLDLTKKGYKSTQFALSLREWDFLFYIDLIKHDGINVEILEQTCENVTIARTFRTYKRITGKLKLIWKTDFRKELRAVCKENAAKPLLK